MSDVLNLIAFIVTMAMFLTFLLLISGVIKLPERKPKPVLCSERWWDHDPTIKCMRLREHRGDHVYYDPGTGHGDERRYAWPQEEL